MAGSLLLFVGGGLASDMNFGESFKKKNQKSLEHYHFPAAQYVSQLALIEETESFPATVKLLCCSECNAKLLYICVQQHPKPVVVLMLVQNIIFFFC